MSFLEVDGSKIHFQTIESRNTESKVGGCVIFLHGLIMDNMSSWFFTIANPASQFAKALIYDLRGHGFSDRPKVGYTIEDHIEDLKKLIESEAGGGPVILVGNSFGGLLAVNYASRYPSGVQGLILVDAQINDSDWKTKMLGSLDLRGDERDQLINLNFQNWRGRHSPRKANRLADNAIELAYGTTLIEDLRGASNITDEELERISAKCFAIYGQESDILATGLRLEEALPDCELTIFEGCTHSVLWEKTDAVREWILASIQTVLALPASFAGVRRNCTDATQLGV